MASQLTQAQRVILILLAQGQKMYKGSKALYVRTETFEKVSIRLSTVEALEKLGYVEHYAITDAGLTAIGMSKKEQ